MVDNHNSYFAELVHAVDCDNVAVTVGSAGVTELEEKFDAVGTAAAFDIVGDTADTAAGTAAGTVAGIVVDTAAVPDLP